MIVLLLSTSNTDKVEPCSIHLSSILSSQTRAFGMGVLVNPSLALPMALQIGLPAQTSHLFSLLFTSTYVGSIYLSQLFTSATTAKTSRTTSTPAIPPISATDVDGQIPASPPGPAVGSRDHPETILRRMKAVGTATILSIGGVFYVVKTSGSYLSWLDAVSPSVSTYGHVD